MKRYEEMFPKPVYTPPVYTAPVYSSGSGFANYPPRPMEQPAPPPAPVEPVKQKKIKRDRETASPGSAFADHPTRSEINRTLWESVRDPSPNTYVKRLEKYMERVKTPWDFIFLTKVLKASGNRTHDLESLSDRWLGEHMKDFLALNPEIDDIKFFAESCFYDERRATDAIEEGMKRVESIEDYFDLIRYRKGPSPGTRELSMDRLIEKTIPTFLAMDPAAQYVAQLSDHYAQSKASFMTALLDGAANPEQFLSLAASGQKWIYPPYVIASVETAVAKKARKFFSLNPSVDQKRALVYVFSTQELRDRYTKEMLASAGTPADFLALARSASNNPSIFEGEEFRRGDRIVASLKDYAKLKPTTDEIAALFEAAYPSYSAQLEVARLGFKQAKGMDDFLKIAKLRTKINNFELKWKFAKLVSSYRDKFESLDPIEEDWQEFFQYSTTNGTSPPPLTERCSDWVKGLWRGVTGG
jgi:hypothetical protein